jgi:phosphatidylserine decarboxylase
MNVRAALLEICRNEDLNFLLTNRLPRRLATRFMGWFSKIEQPLIRDLSIAVWRLFAELDLREAKKSEFLSLHDCFTRELKDGARPIASDPRVVVSPCDGIVGACGPIEGVRLIQAKGFPYTLRDLLVDPELEGTYRNGCYVTLRLMSSMYHRFHAPYDCTVNRVTYVSGDTWNVNPIALKRVEKLFCKNERAIVQATLHGSQYPVALVAVAAVLVASIRLHFADVLLHLKYAGPNEIPCAAQVAKGQELGWFQHGSTIIVFAPQGFRLHPSVQEGTRVKMGEPLLNLLELR